MYKIKSPVLLLVFNRPDTTERVFESIRKGKPHQLFIAADGPRKDKDLEQELCRRTKEILTVDWDCEVKTLYREENLGCGEAIHSAIDWFFSFVPQGIILEDDCLPEPDFFRFCDEMLYKYADNEQIYEISGTNLQGGVIRGDGSYYFCKYGGIWGWATWARAWEKYDFDMAGLSEFINGNQISKTFKSSDQQKYWNRVLSSARQIDTWDYQWLYTIWKNSGICIVPNSNLIDNIGFSNNATHTVGTPSWYSKLTANRKSLGTIKHPTMIRISENADDFIFENAIRINRFLRLRNLVSRILKSKIQLFTVSFLLAKIIHKAY